MNRFIRGDGVDIVDNECQTMIYGKVRGGYGADCDGHCDCTAGRRSGDVHCRGADEREHEKCASDGDIHGVEPCGHHCGHCRREYDVASNRQYRGNHTYVNVMITTGEFPHFPPAMG